MDAAAILDQIKTRSAVTFHSTAQLSAEVRRKAARLEKERAEKAEVPPEPVPNLSPVPEAQAVRNMDVTPWELVQVLGRATALAMHGPSLTIAQHWSCLRYVTALQAGHRGRMERSGDGRKSQYHRKGVQAQDLGIAFGLAAALRLLERRHRGYRFEVVDADLALEAGWRLRAEGKHKAKQECVKHRPGYFLVGRRPGAPLRVASVACRGSHGPSEYQVGQLARSAPHIRAVASGDYADGSDLLPGIALATGQASEGGIETRLLTSAGGGGLLSIPGKAAPDLDGVPEGKNLEPGIACAEPKTGERITRAGFSIAEHDREWFSQVLVRASAAALLTFAGDRESAHGLLSTRAQQNRLGEENSEVGAGMLCDVAVQLGGVSFMGTDHVFRIKRQRVEVFSGISANSYRLLRQHQLEEHERELARLRHDWPRIQRKAEAEWGGVLHLDGSGALLAIREQGRGEGAKLTEQAP